MDSNPAVQLTIRVYSSNQIMGDARQLRGFLDSVSALGWMEFTELEVARLAASWEMLPLTRSHFRIVESVPSFTIQARDIGCVVVDSKQKFAWNLLVEGEPQDTDVSPSMHFTLNESQA
jgi:hypothetical protein